MKNFFALFGLLSLLLVACSKGDFRPDSEKDPGSDTLTVDTLHYLALGDSYTIGTGIAAQAGYPWQLRQQLNGEDQAEFYMAEPDVIAKAGWTSSQLLQELNRKTALRSEYHLVSLLIGVNNQYQSRPFLEFERDFEDLLSFAIEKAAGDSSRVVLISIPDYAYTPFGQSSSNPSLISAEIDKYNGYIENQARALGLAFFNITPISRRGLAEPELVADDRLHPSALMYEAWVELILEDVRRRLLE